MYDARLRVIYLTLRRCLLNYVIAFTLMLSRERCFHVDKCPSQQKSRVCIFREIW